eukprot:CAMPEP_0181170398 /NCGR_PEP_ID=MMETSP1096-20121128/1342_1 /TAXON_ID=156174 ORGANISM="Chrysochromulina ericina, Strain CCMP281" /NCGR_SAMPLE_ID=MMETSP1096 /ASSEMBLY_ACC=CAM_ASM_000453 /LENGTH=85 /DNA_ID=CAMNT_0023257951 /DNA_START=514 /DNA_END=771 /DNA_ORIENTATION=+
MSWRDAYSCAPLGSRWRRPHAPAAGAPASSLFGVNWVGQAAPAPNGTTSAIQGAGSSGATGDRLSRGRHTGLATTPVVAAQGLQS